MAFNTKCIRKTTSPLVHIRAYNLVGTRQPPTADRRRCRPSPVALAMREGAGLLPWASGAERPPVPPSWPTLGLPTTECESW